MDLADIGLEHFETPDLAAWEQLAQKALKGVALESLTARTADGLAVLPVQPRAADASPLPIPSSDRWSIDAWIDGSTPDEAAEQCRRAIARGADRLVLVGRESAADYAGGLAGADADWSGVLADAEAESMAVRIEAQPAILTEPDSIAALVQKRREKAGLSLVIDLPSWLARFGPDALGDAEWGQSLFALWTASRKAGADGVALEAGGRVVHNAGGTPVQELAFVLAGAVAQIRLLIAHGAGVADIVPSLGASLSVNRNQILSTAKLRALRHLWARLAEVLECPPAPLAIHAETSFRMLTSREPDTNILRNSIAGLAAATGGADSLVVLPHSLAGALGKADDSRRVAISLQHVLKDEAQLALVGDPAAGSGTFEDLTTQLCQKAWAAFQAIEAEGGLLESLKQGRFQAEVHRVRRQEDQRLRDGALHLVGTTLHAHQENAGGAPASTDTNADNTDLAPVLLETGLAETGAGA